MGDVYEEWRLEQEDEAARKLGELRKLATAWVSLNTEDPIKEFYFRWAGQRMLTILDREKEKPVEQDGPRGPLDEKWNER